MSTPSAGRPLLSLLSLMLSIGVALGPSIYFRLLAASRLESLAESGGIRAYAGGDTLVWIVLGALLGAGIGVIVSVLALIRGERPAWLAVLAMLACVLSPMASLIIVKLTMK